MRYKVMSVRDRAANIYGQPFFVASTGVAIRGFRDEINRQADGNMLYAHPEDFDLFSLGEFDDNSGEFIVESPQQVMIGKDCKEKV